MKIFLVLATLFVATFASNEAFKAKLLKQAELDKEMYKRLYETNSHITVQEIFNTYKTEAEFKKALKVAGITAVLNDYADKIIANIDNFIITNGLDPLNLPDMELDLILGGKITMAAGWLQETSTLKRNGDVVVSYDAETGIFAISIPIEFETLMFTYDYGVSILLLNINGGIEGKVENVRVNFELTFDFNTYHAALQNFDVTDTGRFTIHFTGNGLVDWLINAMSDAVTLVLHPLIISIIQSFITGPIESIVDAFNNLVDSILHPATTTAASAFF